VVRLPAAFTEAEQSKLQMKVLSISAWRRAALAITATSLIFAAGMLAGSRLLVPQKTPSNSGELLGRVNELDAELKQLRKSEKQPSEIISNARNSVCFIVSSYRLTSSDEVPAQSLHYRLFATGFLTNDGVVVSNRHVMEPWFGDARAQRLIFQGFLPRREQVLAYFPTLSSPVELSDFVSASDSDVAVARVQLPSSATVSPLHLAAATSAPGDAVVVIGYPLGVTTMLAKSTALPYELSGLRDEQQVDRLARINLIRPSATQGHLSDVIGTSLMYDAATAHGSSGGPVLNMQGEVVGVNAALINGFDGTSLGVSVDALRDLLHKLEKRRQAMNSQSK
jgi:S1-C subfamily serine protease